MMKVEKPPQEYVNQVADISDTVVKAFMLAYNTGVTGGVCCDAALSVLIAIVGVFEKEQQTIDALPYIRDVLEQRLQARMLSEDEDRHSGTVH